ncbi:hypothetical protein G6L68_10255 [Agrobacterium fabrum]|uniref:gp53-like domain-containing protein n=1 Tax=Agrobacterium fabrum TaxID=1176649 RepID=UPI000EF601E0|nr:glycosyl hydrolase family 28-related protein [Agrobacterium fabrum]AYM62926.1 hypothetical protein At12D13_17610 [Agrobacterium fabrum]NTE61025.1 hypothetical protein [Agrobacterium fabrum]
MSTTAPDARITKYQPTAATTEFAALFPVFENSEIAVEINGIERTDFTVSATYTDGISNDAKVIFSDGVTGVVLVVGDREPHRTNRFGAGPIPTRDLNLAFDTIEAEMQEARRDIERAHKAPFGTEGGVFDGTAMANAAANADRAEASMDAAEAARDAALSAVPSVSPNSIAALKAVDTTTHQVAFLTAAGRSGSFVWRAGDFSTQIAADPLNGVYVKADAIPATSGAWVRAGITLLDPRWFGATGDGVTDDTLAMQAWLDFPATARMLPEGTFKCSAQLTSANKHVSILGVSLGKSLILWTNASGGLLFTDTSGVGAISRSSITLSNLAIVTRAAGGGKGITLNYTDSSTVVPFGDASTLTLTNVEVRGDDFYEAGGNLHYWNDAVHLTDTGGVSVSNLKLRGKTGVAGLNGFRITASAQPNIRFFLNNLQFQGFQNAMLVESAAGKSVEGIYLSNYEFIACFRGFYATSGPVHAVEFGTGHIDATVSCIENASTARGSSTWVVGAGAYLQLGNKWNGSYIAGNVIVLDDVDYSRINGAYLLGDPGKTVAHGGVLLRSSDYCSIDGNNLHHFNVGVGMESNGVGGPCVSAIVGAANTFSDVTTKVTGTGSFSFYNRGEDSGAWTLLASNGIILQSGSNVVTLDANGNGSVTFPTPFPSVFKNAHVCNGDTGTAGDASFVVNQSACTTSTLSFSVRPNPGAVGVRVQWDARGK